ncbi:MAG: HD domain-containing protein [Candidatus Bathyarchaeia archaeon]
MLFDKKIIELGKWPQDICSEIEDWNEITDYEMQKTKAASLMSNLILKILGADCSSKGRMRSKRLGNALTSLEQITISTRGLARKFYRDHLNHTIRVALLGRAIGQKSPFNLSPQDLDKLLLASLFHDVAYPLADIDQSIRFSINAIKDCYNIASEALLNAEKKLRFDIEKFSSLPPEILQEYKTKEFDHGILSALEFTSYLKQDANLIKKYEDVIRAIAFHSSRGTRKIKASKEKILSVLILADELQDWGRPSGSSGVFSFIPKIEKFRLDDFMLQGEYKTKNISEFSTLKQICGKAPSLTRIKLPKNFDFSITFPLDNFDEIDLQKAEKSLRKLFKKCVELEKSLFLPSHFRKLYQNNSVFESEYYGKSIPKRIKLGLVASLSRDKLFFPCHDFRLFFNDVTKELFITSAKINEIRHFQFASSPSGFIELRLLSKSDETEGWIKSVYDNKVLDLAMRLLSEIRFFNICVQKIAKFRRKEYPVDIGMEGFPMKKDIETVEKEAEETKLHEHFNLLVKLRDSIRNDNLFFFQES